MSRPIIEIRIRIFPGDRGLVQGERGQAAVHVLAVNNEDRGQTAIALQGHAVVLRDFFRGIIADLDAIIEGDDIDQDMPARGFQ